MTAVVRLSEKDVQKTGPSFLHTVMQKKQIYVVVHHEIFDVGDEYHDHEMVFQVASSVKKALEYIRTSRVEPYSWWEIQVTTLDSEDWPECYGWFGRGGGKLRKRPYEKAVAAYKRCKQDPAHHLNI
jgi:hypothetical protein